jgi:hypothetical protein
MKLHLLFVPMLVLVSCGSYEDLYFITSTTPFNLSDQIRDYTGGEKIIRGGGIYNRPIIGQINSTGQFSIAIPAYSKMGKDRIIDGFERCKSENTASSTNPLNFDVENVYLEVFPSKDSPDSEYQGSLYQSTCDSSSCVFPAGNFRVRTIHVSQPMILKNYTCTVAPFNRDVLNGGDNYNNLTYNFNLDLKTGWNTIRFVQISRTVGSEIFDVENFSGLPPDWHLKPSVYATPMSQHPGKSQ